MFAAKKKTVTNPQKLHMERGAKGKTAVTGLCHRGAKVIAVKIAGSDKETLRSAIFDSVEIGSTIMTGEHKAHSGLKNLFYRHEKVNQVAREYTRGTVSVNSIESVWALLMRGILGTRHQESVKHLRRYVYEVAFRFNDGNVERHTPDRLASFIYAVDGKLLTYARFIG